MNLTLAETALGSGAKLEAPASAQGVGALVARGYSIDSRTIGAGELFFAVRGERLDGHDFILGALQRGAVGAVVSVARVATLPDAVLEVPLLIVEDPLQALQSLAAFDPGRNRGSKVRVSSPDSEQGSRLRCFAIDADPSKLDDRLRDTMIDRSNRARIRHGRVSID